MVSCHLKNSQNGNLRQIGFFFFWYRAILAHRSASNSQKHHVLWCQPRTCGAHCSPPGKAQPIPGTLLWAHGPHQGRNKGVRVSAKLRRTPPSQPTRLLGIPSREPLRSGSPSFASSRAAAWGMFQTSEKNSSHRSPPVMHRRVGFGEIACLQSVLDRQSPTSSVVHLGGVKSPLATGQSIVRHSSHQRPFFFNATRWALRAFLSRLFSSRASFPQIGVKIKNVWNHHLDMYIPGPSSRGARWFRYRVEINHNQLGLIIGTLLKMLVCLYVYDLICVYFSYKRVMYLVTYWTSSGIIQHVQMDLDVGVGRLQKGATLVVMRRRKIAPTWVSMEVNGL